jgi:hypothetical protein
MKIPKCSSMLTNIINRTSKKKFNALSKPFLLFFLLFMFVCKGGIAQAPKIDSDLRDTIGFQAELSLIEYKIGPIPDSIRQGLVALELSYYGFQQNGEADTTQLRKGVLIVHQSVQEDIVSIFAELRRDRFPIAKIIPVNKYGLNRDTTGWDDRKSMEDNNTSAFNYRFITHSTDLSPHGLGNAIDFNPLFNPYEAYHHDGKQVEPDDAFYDQSRPGTISDSILVGYFDKRGWTWGGRWNNPVDFQHFDKRPGRGRKHYLMKESSLKDYFRYGDGDGSIAIYAEPYDKKQAQPEIVLYKGERPIFLHYMHWMLDRHCHGLFKDKGKLSWVEFIKLDNWYLERFSRDSIHAVEYMNEKGIRSDFEFDKNSKLPLKGYCIQLSIQKHTKLRTIENLNENCAAHLRKLLEAAGARVFEHYLGMGTRDTVYNGAYLTFSMHLNISIGFGNEEMYSTAGISSENFQTLYVPGAWKQEQMQTPIDRLNFLRALISDDLPRSIELAKFIQGYLATDLGLSPVSRQLPGPNLLETDCIKTDYDGIYCRHIAGLNDLQCPVVYVAPFSVYNAKALSLLTNKKEQAQISSKTAKAIYQGILTWLGE